MSTRLPTDRELLDWQYANHAEVQCVGSYWFCAGHADETEPLVVTHYGTGKDNRAAIIAAMEGRGA